MRLWNYTMLPFLPDMQLKSQWRECVLIAKDLKEKGKTNHLLINILENYPYNDFLVYCWLVYSEMHNRGFEVKLSTQQKVFDRHYNIQGDIFNGWHNKEYLRVCYANLFEKHKFGRGKSRITEEEWRRLLVGYKSIANEDYKI